MVRPSLPVARAPGRRPSRARRRLRALLWRSRLVVLALGCGLVAAVVVGRLAPPLPATRPVVVTARDVEAGTVLEASDVALVHVALDLAPETSLPRVRDAVGRTTSVALPRGHALAPSLVAAGDLASSAPAGTVVVPVRLADPAVAALLQPGDRIDLLASSGAAGGAGGADSAGEGGDYLARRALVLAGPPTPQEPGGLLGGDSPDSGVTLVAVLATEATALAGVGEWGGLSVVLVP